jgi:sulfite oxidase
MRSRLFSSSIHIARTLVRPIFVKNRTKKLHAVLGAVGVVSFITVMKGRQTLYSAEEKDETLNKVGEVEDGLPEFTLEEIAKHNGNNGARVWVTYKYGVYDVTNFVKEHPGGEKILLAAGGAVDSFWSLYAVHKSAHVFEILEKLRIGNISKKDRAAIVKQVDIQDPYSTDPVRFPGFRVRSNKPFNAEPPLSLLIDKYITPNEIFFVRNHLPVPQVDAETYHLTVTGKGINKDLNLSLEDLKTKFPKHTITATIQCSGNRRSEMSASKPVKGLEWTAGAISTAEWTGVLLSDVLKYAKLDTNGVKHVQFEGLDHDPHMKAPYGGSISIHRAIDPKKDVLLAFQMNGQDLPRDHGYPVRVIVPGVVGARNVKWLKRIVTSEEESSSFFQKHDYKGFSPAVEYATEDIDKTAPAIQELPVQSAICSPTTGYKVQPGDLVSIKGYAWSGGGRDIIRVDLKSNGLQEPWITADLNKEIEQETGRAWAWTPFEANVEIPEDIETKEVEICSRAVDDSYNVQPETVANIWNFRGVLANAWSCIKLEVERGEK